ncbi:MAG: flagellar FlbD family protein [Chloroflexi bacterium]|nr:flagellar FlbD family protein [Chloroflexota bacterium]
MITVTRFDGSEFVINSDLIETVEATPDTVITFSHDKKVVVRETPDEIVERMVQYRRRIYLDPAAVVQSTDERPTRDQLSHMHKGAGAPKRFRLVSQDDQEES